MSRRSTKKGSGSRGLLGLFLRSLLFTVGLTGSTVIYALLMLLTFPLPYPLRFRIVTGWTRFNLWWLAKTCRLYYEVEGLDNIPTTPTIVLSKHQSAWETLSLQLIFAPQVWVLKRELLWIPFFGWGLAMLKPIAIDRKAGTRAIQQVIEQGRKRLAAGCWVVIFPEGTRIAPGKMGPFHVGGAALAQKTGYPIVPVAHNAGEFWPRNSFIKRPGTIRLVIGPPIESTGRRAAELNQLAAERIKGMMAQISDWPPDQAREMPCADGGCQQPKHKPEHDETAPHRLPVPGWHRGRP